MALAALFAQPALAQELPGGPPMGPGFDDAAPMEAAAGPGDRAEHGPNATVSLNMAYRAIGAAEAAGARGSYLDSAKAHYRSALARFGKGDTAGASSEARAASDLARASLAELPPATPKDLPTPPKITAAVAPAADRGAGMRPPGGGGWGSHGGPGGPPPMRGWMGHHDVDAEELGRFVSVENTNEVRTLAQAALAANAAAQQAALAGNLEEAGRKRMLAASLAGAVRAIAFADHPELLQHPARPSAPPAG
jgi:hypothetical protein